MTTILEAVQSKIEQITTLFGFPADLSDPDSPTFEYRGRLYVVTAVEPYITKAGGETRVITLVADCETCGTSFEYKTGWNKLSLYANCTEHRKSGPSGRMKALVTAQRSAKSVEPEPPANWTDDDEKALWEKARAELKAEGKIKNL